MFVVYTRIEREIEWPIGVYSLLDLAHHAAEQDVLDAFPTTKLGKTEITETDNLIERLYLDADGSPLICYVIIRTTVDAEPPKRDRSMPW